MRGLVCPLAPGRSHSLNFCRGHIERRILSSNRTPERPMYIDGGIPALGEVLFGKDL